MGVIITPPGGGVTYPNITDVNDVVNITPFSQSNITSDAINLLAADQVNLNSNNNGDCNVFSFNAFNITSTNIANILADNAYIVTDGGKIGFFSDTNSAVQANAIVNATVLNVVDQVNEILNALRSYGLIKT